MFFRLLVEAVYLVLGLFTGGVFYLVVIANLAYGATNRHGQTVIDEMFNTIVVYKQTKKENGLIQ